MKLELGKVKVGDGITGHMYSDAHAYTVIRVSPSGKTFWAQQDKATLKEDWKPEFLPGGFRGHCTNQGSQGYDYEPDPNGSIIQWRWSEGKQCFQCLTRFRAISAGRTTSNSYNGWKNYETWNVVLWINNREDLYVSARDFMARYKGRRPYKDWILYMWSGDRVLPYCTPDGVMYYDSALSYRELNDMMRELTK